VQAAAAFLAEHPETSPGGSGSPDPARRALMALEIHELFLGRDDETDDVTVVAPDVQQIRAALGGPIVRSSQPGSS
jgi:hypothetical protein